MNVTKLLYVLLCVFFFLVGIANGQDFVDAHNFKNKIAKDIVAIEFWVEWNKTNEFSEFVELNDCDKYREYYYKKCKLIKQNLSSAAFGDNDLIYINMKNLWACLIYEKIFNILERKGPESIDIKV